MSGVLVNLITVAAGALIGTLIGELFNERLRDICFQAVGLAVFGMGIVMGYDGLTSMGDTNLGNFSMIVYALSLVVGALIGELLQLDKKLDNLGVLIEKSVAKLPKRKNKGASTKVADGAETLDTTSKFVEGFVSASILFCVGTMAVLGSIQDGLGDPSTLYLKSVLDGFSAIILASTMGIGVGFSVLPLLVIQGGISLFAQFLEPYMGPAVLSGISAVGGVMLIAIATNILGFKEIKVVNMLPAIVIVGLIGVFF